MSERRVERDGGPPLISFGIFDWLDRNQGMSLADQYQQRLRVAEYADEQASGATTWPSTMAPLQHASLAQYLPGRDGRAPVASAWARWWKFSPLPTVRIIEEICMLDNLTSGRLKLGVMRSSDAERSMYGIDAAQSRACSGVVRDRSGRPRPRFGHVRRRLLPGQERLGAAGAAPAPLPAAVVPHQQSDSVPWIGEQGSTPCSASPSLRWRRPSSRSARTGTAWRPIGTTRIA